MRTTRVKNLGVYIHPNRRRPRCNALKYAFLLYAEYMWGNSDATVLPYIRQRPLHLTNCNDSPIPYVYSSVESSDVLWRLSPSISRLTELHKADP